MANLAAQNLAALTQAAQGEQEKAERQAAAARDAGMRGASLGRQQEAEEADFAGPEALATAVAAGFILGPAGGLLMGLAQGFLGKKERQNILDQQAKDNEALNDSRAILESQFDNLRQGATGPEDLRILDGLQTQQDAAFRLLFSGTPQLQEQGMALLQNVQGEINTFAAAQETQRIEADVRDAELQRVLSQESYDRFNSIKVRFDDDSRGYEEVMGATNVAMEALTKGSPADLWAAGILVNRALDPTSVVRPEEAAAVGKLGSLWTQAEVILEKARNGTTILPEERRNLQSLLGTIQQGAQQIQLAREARYFTELEDAEVPVRYWDNFRLVDSVPAAERGEIRTAPQNEPPPQPGEPPAPADPSTLDQAADGAGSLLDRAQLWTTDMIEDTMRRLNEGRYRDRPVN
jgi:hypothetical protein